jgi:hypothetical protein
MRIWGKPIALGIGLGWAAAVLIFYSFTVGLPVDAWCYYGFDPATPWDPDHCFLYSPPVAQVMLVIEQAMPFDAFYTGLRVVEMIALALIVGPAIGLALLIPAVAIEINAANVNLILVGAVLLGFRYPWTWAFVILTKVTPGVALLWFAVRREWRHLAIALGATVAVVVVSYLIAPWMWGSYLSQLAQEPDESPFTFWVRLPFAILFVIWGARTDRRWALIVAVFLLLPRWYYLSPVILVGLFRTVRFPRPLPWVRWWNDHQPRLLVSPRGDRHGQTASAMTSNGRTDAAPSS